MLGRTIQNYRVEELLGEGGMGTVYKATDTVLRRHVALKMLHNHLVRDSTFMDRFQNEAILSAQLNHPNVTTLYNFFQHQNDNLIVMELVSGITVEKFLKQHGRLSLDTALKIVMQTLDGLLHAHSKGILHRDIKAANLMLTPDGVVKLMDFGIARLEGSTRLTRADRVVGTLEYMAPELLNGANPSVQSDLYAVGVLMYELLSGKMPFESSTDITLISQILTKKPIALKSRIPVLPKSVEDILERLFQKNPEKRYRSAGELRSALAAIVAPGTVDAMLSINPKSIPMTQFSDRHVDKPQANPTRLASHGQPQEKQSFWNLVKTNAMTLEGAILAGALLLATGIISVWSFSGTPVKKAMDSAAIEQAILKPQIKNDTTPRQEIIHPVQNFSAEEAVVKPLEEIPAETYVPPVTKKRYVSPQPVKTTPSKAEIPAEKQEEEYTRPEPAKPAVKTTLELKGESFSAEFSQTISSEDNMAGQVFWLHAVTPVTVNGIVVVRSGARVKGRIDKTISKADHKRSGLWFTLEAAEAVDGQWIPLNFKWDDTAFHALELKRGFILKRIRTFRGNVTFAR
ncbi:serine/threonine-protein kinase [Dyadobacter sp. CY323]|uniref:serine/threonine-protein kinase n=1 Tax=Dyadobacter sp. CY323 TaxID=2907302 RepID=UPI001F418F32|nr:serine/threonine-protein kinase [Dyadobacter sp. CY323]MCE6991374.1 serine/threonine protein kinase [Dyadobacter sp. CY323]